MQTADHTKRGAVLTAPQHTLPVTKARRPAPAVYFPIDDAAARHYWSDASLARLRRIANIAAPPDPQRPWHGLPTDTRAIITGWGVAEQLPKAVWSELPDLKLIAIFGGSTQCIEAPLEALKRGIILTNTAREIAEGVAEETLALMLASLYDLVPSACAFKQSGELKWPDGKLNRSLSGSTVGIVGFGMVGRKVAELLAPFQVELLVHDPYASPDALARHGAQGVELPVLLERSDIISVHAGLTPESEGMFTAERLDRIRVGALLISTARMRLFDQHALAARVRDGRIRFASDFVPFDRDIWCAPEVRAQPNLVAVPGHTSITTRTLQRMGDRIVDDLSRMLEDRPLPDCLTADWIRHTT